MNHSVRKPSSVLLGIFIGVFVSACTNGVVRGDGKSSTQSNSLTNPTLGGGSGTSGTGALEIDATIIGAYRDTFNGGGKGVVLNIQTPMAILAQSYGGLTEMMKRTTSDPSFGSQTITIKAYAVGLVIQMPLGKLHLPPNGALRNAIIIRPEGRMQFVSAPNLSEEPTAVRMTDNDAVTVYGGKIDGIMSRRVIRLGYYSVATQDSITDAVSLWGSSTSKPIAISVSPNDASNISAGIGGGGGALDSMTADFSFIRRTSYTPGWSDACSDPQYENTLITSLTTSPSSSYVITYKSNGTTVDEIAVCGEDPSNGNVVCKDYYNSLIVATKSYCGATRSIEGIDPVKTGKLSGIAGNSAIKNETLPANMPVHADPDGTGQIHVTAI